jgi:hypothetical protein
MNGTKIQTRDHVRDLGILVSCRIGNFRQHIANIVKKPLTKISTIIQQFRHLPNYTLLHLFTLIARRFWSTVHNCGTHPMLEMLNFSNLFNANSRAVYVLHADLTTLNVMSFSNFVRLKIGENFSIWYLLIN